MFVSGVLTCRSLWVGLGIYLNSSAISEAQQDDADGPGNG